MTLDEFFNLSVSQFLICRIRELYFIVLLGRVNEILVLSAIDGVLDLMKFSNGCNIPGTEPGTE